MGAVRHYTIRKGRHRINNAVLTYLWNLLTPLILFRRTQIVVSCRLHVPEGISIDDQAPLDHWNKLFGFTSWRIHRNSWRLGWAYNPHTGKWEFCKYEYINGIRLICKMEYGDIAIISALFKLKPGIYWRCFPFYGGRPKSNGIYRFSITEERVRH